MSTAGMETLYICRGLLFGANSTYDADKRPTRSSKTLWHAHRLQIFPVYNVISATPHPDHDRTGPVLSMGDLEVPRFGAHDITLAVIHIHRGSSLARCKHG